MFFLIRWFDVLILNARFLDVDYYRFGIINRIFYTFITIVIYFDVPNTQNVKSLQQFQI